MSSDNQSAASDGERRQVTVLFADLAGFTAFSERSGEEATYKLMQRIVKLLREAVQEHGGTVRSFTGDGIMALFGVPQALEDAPLRACRAALLMQERLAARAIEIETIHGMRPQLRISVNTGLAVVGRVDGEDGGGATALGDAINLAARLQTVAQPTTIVLSEATHRLVEGMVQSHFVGMREIKGKSEPQRVFQLNALRAGAVRFDAVLSRGLTTYIGRDRELETLERLLAEARSELRVIDVSGEPGIGKSRLLYEFHQRLAKTKAFVLAGSCAPDAQQTPFLPFIEVVRGSFRVAVGEAEAAVTRKLEDGLKILGMASSRNLGLLLNLLGLKPSEGSLVGLDGTLIGLKTRDLLQQLLAERCRVSPVLMMLEDLHWIDSASEELLGKIIETGGRLALTILYTHRPEYQPPWREQRSVSALVLEPLSGAETARMVRARLGVDRLPQELARLIAEKAEGNALFAEEIVSFLLEQNLIRREPGTIDFDAAALASALPASVQSLLSARIDRLSQRDRALLQAAAVIGRRFDAELLLGVAEADPTAPLATAAALDLVHRDQKSGSYFFKHALVRDALYESLLTAPRAALHLKIAKEVERRSGNRIEEVVEVLAHHYALSHLADKAFFYLSAAGRKSLEVYSLDEADRQFRQALRLVDSDPRCAPVHAVADTVTFLLQVMFLKGDLREVGRVAERYMPMLEATEDRPQIACALYFYCLVLANWCDFRTAEALAKRNLEIAGRLGEPRARAYARTADLYVSSILARYSLEEAERMATELIADCNTARDNYILNWAHFAIAFNYIGRGLMNEARDRAWRLMADGRERDDRRAIGMAHWLLCWVNIVDARYEDAIANAEESLRTAIAPFDHNAALAGSATASILLGHAMDGLAQLEEVRRWTAETDFLYLQRNMTASIAAAYVLTGRLKEGIALLERTIDASDKDGDRGNACWSRIFLAEIYIEILASRQQVALSVVLKNFGTILRAKLFGARLARELLEDASQEPQLHELGTLRARINMDLGLLHKIAKRRDLARQYFEKARGPAELQGAAMMVSKIDVALAELRD
jgi:class 3 adenylate cyclase/tetratricopeptide (TPR) repeat protein